MILLTYLLIACADETPPPPSNALAAAAAPKPLPAATTIREGADLAGLDWPPSDLWVRVDKSERLLTVLSGETPLVHWPTGLGGAPTGDKVRQGDQKTPVGTFRIVTRNPKSSYHLFLGISYPNTADAERGRDAGWLTDSEVDAIASATASGEKPLWNTTLGGAIGIHGGGGSADWTLGCMALDNHQIDELWDLAPHGTRVDIQE